MQRWRYKRIELQLGVEIMLLSGTADFSIRLNLGAIGLQFGFLRMHGGDIHWWIGFTNWCVPGLGIRRDWDFLNFKRTQFSIVL